MKKAAAPSSGYQVLRVHGANSQGRGGGGRGRGYANLSAVAGVGRRQQRDARQASSSSTITISTAEYLKLLQNASNAEEYGLPSDFLVAQVALRGSAKDEVVQFSVEVAVQVLSVAKGWVRIPLCDAACTLTVVTLLRDGTIVDHTKALVYGNEKDGFTYGDGGFVTCHGGFYCLYTHLTGLYTISFDAAVPYSSSKKNSVKLSSLPMSPLGNLHFTVPQPNAQISLLPSLGTVEVNVGPGATCVEAAFPPTAEIALQWSERAAVEAVTPIEMPLEPKKTEFPSTAEAKTAVITSTQHCLVAVGEGVVSATVVIEYAILHATVSTFEVYVPSSVRVLSASGPSLRGWEMVDAADVFSSQMSGGAAGGSSSASAVSAAAPSINSGGGGGGGGPRGEPKDKGKAPTVAEEKVLRVTLSYPAESAYTLTFVVEANLPSSGVFDLPCFKTLKAVREKGFLGVVPISTVEIEQIEQRGSAITKVDVSELPSTLTSLSGRTAILLGYKYLVADHAVRLLARRHADVPVLVALIEDMMVEVTYTSEGKCMYHVRLVLVNNDRQYLRLDANIVQEVWTTMVGGEIVKPARDGTRFLMLPIPKSSTERVTVEVAFLAPPMIMDGVRGSLEFALPLFDMPICALRVTVYMPNQPLVHEYTAVDCDLQTPSTGSRPVFGSILESMINPSSGGYGAPTPSSNSWARAQVLDEQVMYDLAPQMDRLERAARPKPMARRSRANRARYNESDDDDDEDNSYLPPPAPMRGGGGRGGRGATTVRSEMDGRLEGGDTAGAQPVKLIPPKIGRAILFNRVLVSVDEPQLHVVVEYKPISKGCCS